METQVPYTVMSFDIEASSSHGDFPLAKKSYKALAKNMVDVWDDRTEDKRTNEYIDDIIKTAFGYCYEPVFNVDRIYPKQQPPESMVDGLTKAFVKRIVKNEDFAMMTSMTKTVTMMKHSVVWREPRIMARKILLCIRDTRKRRVSRLV